MWRALPFVNDYPSNSCTLLFWEWAKGGRKKFRRSKNVYNGCGRINGGLSILSISLPFFIRSNRVFFKKFSIQCATKPHIHIFSCRGMWAKKYVFCKARKAVSLQYVQESAKHEFVSLSPPSPRKKVPFHQKNAQFR